MIVLTATTDNLQVNLAGAVATSELACYASWRDVTTAAYTPGYTQTATNGVTDVNVVPAPGASTQRVADYVSVYNGDTAAATVRVKFDANGTERMLWCGTLQPSEKVEYVEGAGWRVLSTQGVQKTSPSLAASVSSAMMAPQFATANLTGTKTITSGSTFAVYVGKAPRALTSVQVRSRVTTAMATITWGEVAIAKGAVVVGGNPSLTVVGFADVSATFNSTGRKTTAVSVSSGQAINEGDDLWVLIGNSATTAAIMRAQSIADDLQVGLQASLATRPSSNVGSAQTYTLEGATTRAAWVALLV